MDNNEEQLMPWTYNDPAIIRNVDMYQGLISRMASNSASCKQWAVALVSAVLVLIARDGQMHFAILAAIPAILFAFLDAYYLGLEKKFRRSMNRFLADLYSGRLQDKQIFRVDVDGRLPRDFLDALLSWSVWPFYLSMLVLVALAKLLVY